MKCWAIIDGHAFARRMPTYYHSGTVNPVRHYWSGRGDGSGACSILLADARPLVAREVRRFKQWPLPLPERFRWRRLWPGANANSASVLPPIAWQAGHQSRPDRETIALSMSSPVTSSLMYILWGGGRVWKLHWTAASDNHSWPQGVPLRSVTELRHCQVDQNIVGKTSVKSNEKYPWSWTFLN